MGGSLTLRSEEPVRIAFLERTSGKIRQKVLAEYEFPGKDRLERGKCQQLRNTGPAVQTYQLASRYHGESRK